MVTSVEFLDSSPVEGMDPTSGAPRVAPQAPQFSLRSTFCALSSSLELESQWPTSMSYFQSILDYFVVQWAAALGCLAFQVEPESRGTQSLCPLRSPPRRPSFFRALRGSARGAPFRHFRPYRKNARNHHFLEVGGIRLRLLGGTHTRRERERERETHVCISIYTYTCIHTYIHVSTYVFVYL